MRENLCLHGPRKETDEESGDTGEGLRGGIGFESELEVSECDNGPVEGVGVMFD